MDKSAVPYCVGLANKFRAENIPSDVYLGEKGMKQKMKYAAEGIDVDTDTIIGGMKKMKKSLDKNKDTFKTAWNNTYTIINFLS